MKFKIIHTNFNVMDLEKSVSFYEKALGLKVMRRHEAQDGSFGWCLWVMESRTIRWN